VATAAAGFTLLVFLALNLSTELWRDASAGRKADGLHWRFSVSTGSTSLLLLGVSLTLGPIRSLRKPATRPLTQWWRRATGIWAAIFAAIHSVLGVTIHSNGWRVYVTFLELRSYPDRLLVTLSLGFWVGAMAAATMVILGLTSNNASVRRLGARRWKRIHRFAFLALGLNLLHVSLIFYQERRDLRHVSASIGFIAVVIGVRLFVSRRQRYILAELS
jgi:DMSO/TMAO reductase YedYZ heme-binding membrane subunit